MPLCLQVTLTKKCFAVDLAGPFLAGLAYCFLIFCYLRDMNVLVERAASFNCLTFGFA